MICIRKCRQCGRPFDAKFGSKALLCKGCAGGAPKNCSETEYEMHKKPPINYRPKVLRDATSFDEEISILDSVARKENTQTKEDAMLAAAMEKLLMQFR